MESLEQRDLLAITSIAAGGLLTVTLNAADNVAITASGGNVLVNGANPTSGAAAASGITSIQVVASGNFANSIDLSGVTSAAFPNIPATGAVSVNGGPGNDTITGSDFGDELIGGGGANELNGGNGDDILDISGGTASVNAGGGLDTIRYIGTNAGGETVSLSATATERLELTGTSGPDTLTVSGGAQVFIVLGLGDNDTIDASGITNPNAQVTLNGGAGNDTITGGAAGDLIIVGGGSDNMTGNDGDDIFDLSGGTATVNPGAGTDTIRYIATNPAGETVSLSATATERLELTGSSGPDTLTVAGGAQVFIVQGLGGADTIDASGLSNPNSQVTLDGGAGNDTITGGAAGDRILDGSGNDQLSGGAGNETYVLTPGSADVVTDTGGNDTVDFSSAALGITINMDSAAVQVVDSAANTVQLVGQIENFIGSPQADNVTANLLGVARSFVGSASDTVTIGSVLAAAGPASTANVQGMTTRFAATVNFPISSATPGSGFPQVTAGGAVDLTGSTLALSLVGGFVPPGATSFRIIDKTSGGAVTGTFSGLAEGAAILVGGTVFRISYVGGDGNDVVLTTAETTADIVGGNLVINDIVAGGKTDSLTLRFDSATNEIIVSDPNHVISSIVGVQASAGNQVRIPVASVTGQVLVNTLAGNDTLLVDHGANAASRFPRDLTYDAGAGGDDALNFQGGGTFNLNTYNYAGPHSGDVRFDPDGPGGVAERVFTYSNIEPLANTGTATNMVFNLPAGADVARLSDLVGTFRLESLNASFEMTDFVAPPAAGTLTINLGGGADDISVVAIPTGVTTTINGDAGDDIFRTESTLLTFAANGGADTDTLIGPDAISTWNVTGGGGGNIASGPTFTSINHLTGQSQVDTFNISGNHTGNVTSGGGNDIFNFSGAAVLTGTLNGAAGSLDRLSYAAYGSARSISLTALGTTDGFAGAEASISGGFDNINEIVGSPAADSLSNNLVPAAAATWEVDGTNRFQSGGRDLNFSALENLNGGSLVDTFNVTAAHTGNLAGNAGADVFNITSATLTGSITGGTENDELNLSGSASVTGSFDADGGAGDEIDFSGHVSARSISLTALSATDGFSGTEAAIAGGFSNVNTVIGSSSTDSLSNNLAPAAAATWEIDGTNRFQSGGRDLNFSAIENLNGGSLADTFNVTAAHTGNLAGNAGADVFNITGATLTGNITGGTENDELNLSGAAIVTGSFDADGGAGDEIDFTTYATARNISLTALSATDGFSGTEAAIGGGFSNVNTILGTAAVDSLSNNLVPAAAATWEIDGTNRFQSGGRDLNFSAIENLNGGSLTDTFNVSANHTGNLTGNGGDDAFAFSAAAVLTGAVNGNAGADRINFAAYTSARNVTLTALGTVDGFQGTDAGPPVSITGGFDNIDEIIGTTAFVDSLTGRNSPALWTVDGTNTYESARTLAFGDFETLNGGTFADQFDVLGGSIESGEQNTYNGNGDQDIFNLTLPSNGGLVSAAGTRLTINGGAQAAGQRDAVNIIATADTTPRAVTMTYANAASGDVDVLGIGTANPAGVDLNTIEQLNYAGNAGNDDTVSVVGTAGNDDITVRPTSASAANVFRDGVFTNGVPTGAPGLDGGSAGPDVSLAGLSITGLSVNGAGGSNGLTVQTPAAAAEIVVTNTVVAPSMLVETNYTNIGRTLNIVTGAGDDMVMIDLPDVAGGVGAVTPGVDPNGPLPDFVRVLSDGGADVVKYMDVGADQDHNVINFADLDALALGPVNPNESAFQVSNTECALALAGAGNDAVRNLTLTNNAGFSTNSVMDLGDGNDFANGSNNGRKTPPPGQQLKGDVIYGGAGMDTIIAGTMGVKFLFADFDVAGVEHPQAGDTLNGSANAQVSISAGAGDAVLNHIGGLFGSGFTLDVISWLKARWLTGNGVANAQAFKCADWHTNYSGNDLGDLTTHSVADINPSLADSWYEFDAAATGVLTATATFAPGSVVEIKIFDEHFAPIAWNQTNDGSAVAQAPVTAGSEYYVRVRGLATDVDLDLTIADPMVQPLVLNLPPSLLSVELGDSASGAWLNPDVGSGLQLASTPWSVDRIRVVFSEGVQVAANDLSIAGVNVPSYAALAGPGGFEYDAATRTATWTLAQPIANDKVLVTLSDAVHDAGGLSLDGEWQNPATIASGSGTSSTFPSGNSTAGGAFVLRLNVLDGDADRNGVVDLRDLVTMRDAMAIAGANTAADMNHDGTVDVIDLKHVIYKMFSLSMLPGGDPVSPAPSPSAPQAAAAMVVASHAPKTNAEDAFPRGSRSAAVAVATSLRASAERRAIVATDAAIVEDGSRANQLRAGRALRRSARLPAAVGPNSL